MKKILTIIIIMMSVNSYSQKKLKFNKDIYPLIESKSFKTAKPLLQEFLKENPNNLKANYWLGVLYYGNMAYHDNDIRKNDAEIKLKYYDFIDSSKFHLAKAKKLVNVASLNPISSRFFPDFNGLTSEELCMDAIGKIDSWINLLNTTKDNWNGLQLKRNELAKLRKPYLHIDCESEDEDDYFINNCSWGKYRIYSKYDRIEGIRYVDFYINDYEHSIMFNEMFVSQDDASSFFKGKFEQVYNELKSEDESCFEDSEFFFNLSLVYIIDADDNGLTFGLPNRGILNSCLNIYGESTFYISFEDIVPLIKL